MIAAALLLASAPVVLDVPTVRQLARERSAVLAAARSREEAAAAGEAEARALRSPEVAVSAGYTRLSHVPEFGVALPGQPPQILYPDIPDNVSTRLGLQVPLYTGGRLPALAEAAGQGRAAAGLDRRAAEADLDLEAVSAYWRWVTAREQERVLREGLASYEQHLADARHREEVGIAPRNEVLAVQVERDRAELARLGAAQGADVAGADLRRLLDLPADAEMVPAEPLEPLPGPPEPVEGLVEQALRSRPERGALAARVAAADSSARAEEAARRPSVGASAGIAVAKPNRRLFPVQDTWQDTWDVSVGVDWTVFDGGRRRASAARARAEADAVRARLQDLDRAIRLQVTSAVAELTTARAAAEVAARNLVAAAENRRVAQERYRAGVAPSSDLLDAETLLLRAGLDRTGALARARTARAWLDRAAGN